MVLNRQRRLDMLSAVPLDRRHGKDFEAAFGENLDDAPWMPAEAAGIDFELRNCSVACWGQST